MPRLTRSGPKPSPGIVHFGPGAFFRAFNAVYTQDALDAEGGDWGIVAVSLRSPTARDQLQPQDFAYSSVALGAQSDNVQTINAVCDVLVAPENPEAALALLADPRIKIVSLTITEKGYHPDASAASAIGYLTAGLLARRTAGTPPFTVLSCDNLPDNGSTTRRAVLDYARALDTELAAYIETDVAFPSTMVDRITPASTDADLNRLAEQTGHFDAAAVFHESFRQWVIEDHFPTGRPAWDKVGAQLVRDVGAHEVMKLRCLNGTHSALAYLGYLAGFETISETVGNPDFSAYCEHLWAEEILPTVAPPEGEDLPAYCQSLMVRYRDRSIRHRTWQIAMDGSQKLPQRLLGTISDQLTRGVTPKGLILAVAAWMRYVGGTDEQGHPIDVRDPLAKEFFTASAKGVSAAERVSALLDFNEIFDQGLAADPTFRGALISQYECLEARGAKNAVRKILMD